MSLKAYQKAQVAVENPRSIEYRLFGQITGALMDAKSAGAEGHAACRCHRLATAACGACSPATA